MRRVRDTDKLAAQVDALYDVLTNLYGREGLILRAGKVDALHLMRSDILEERVLGLQRLVKEDPTLARIPMRVELSNLIAELEDYLAELVARENGRTTH